MKSLLEKLLSGAREKDAPEFSVEFIKTRKQILRTLELSQETGTVVGVYSKAFGDGMFLVAVESIEKRDGVEVITFHRYDMSGHILTRNEVDLTEIKMVLPFRGVLKKNVLTNPEFAVARA